MFHIINLNREFTVVASTGENENADVEIQKSDRIGIHDVHSFCGELRKVMKRNTDSDVNTEILSRLLYTEITSFLDGFNSKHRRSLSIQSIFLDTAIIFVYFAESKMNQTGNIPNSN